MNGYGQTTAAGYNELPLCGQVAFSVIFGGYGIGFVDCPAFSKSPISTPIYVNCACTKHSSDLHHGLSSLAIEAGCDQDAASSADGVLSGFCSDNAVQAASLTSAGSGATARTTATPARTPRMSSATATSSANSLSSSPAANASDQDATAAASSSGLSGKAVGGIIGGVLGVLLLLVLIALVSWKKGYMPGTGRWTIRKNEELDERLQRRDRDVWRAEEMNKLNSHPPGTPVSRSVDGSDTLVQSSSGYGLPSHPDGRHN